MQIVVRGSSWSESGSKEEENSNVAESYDVICKNAYPRLRFKQFPPIPLLQKYFRFKNWLERLTTPNKKYAKN